MQKVFLDTNIIIDFLGERADFYAPAAKVLTLADKKKIRLYTSPTSVSNTYYLLTKYENAKTAMEKSGILNCSVLCQLWTMKWLTRQ
ncbi:MAG: PIN domain-containing protein [Chitinophagaceae bacterium]